MHMQVFVLLRNELNSLHVASDGSAVRELAGRILARQEQLEAKYETGEGEITTSYPIGVD
jgi:hypothetical protein